MCENPEGQKKTTYFKLFLVVTSRKRGQTLKQYFDKICFGFVEHVKNQCYGTQKTPPAKSGYLTDMNIANIFSNDIHV